VSLQFCRKLPCVANDSYSIDDFASLDASDFVLQQSSNVAPFDDKAMDGSLLDLFKMRLLSAL
jgi:hypothetical protein